MHAQVIVLAGPSGAGKSRLARRLGLPVVRLDDFYKNGDAAGLPRIADGPNIGLVDWDHAESWLREEAVAALKELCTTGSTRVPVYDIAHNGRTGWQGLGLGSHRFVVAEGIFAAEIVPALLESGLLAAAFCITRSPALTFALRLGRDLGERRKPPLVLVRRGLELARRHGSVVAGAVARGCTPATPAEAYDAVQQLLSADRASGEQ